jgi:hypothetical protein
MSKMILNSRISSRYRTQLGTEYERSLIGLIHVVMADVLINSMFSHELYASQS